MGKSQDQNPGLPAARPVLPAAGAEGTGPSSATRSLCQLGRAPAFSEPQTPARDSALASPGSMPPGGRWGGHPACLSGGLSCPFALQDGSFSLAHTLSGQPGFPDARFGFAMATVGDISQDKLTDVAIGAPLEGWGANDGASFGSVYIYNGCQDGLSLSPSQVTRRALCCLSSGTVTPRCNGLSPKSAPGLSARQSHRVRGPQ